MALLYKLTDYKNRTRVGYDNETKWGRNVTHSVTGRPILCTKGVIHAYRHPLQAAFFSPVHTTFYDRRGRATEPAFWEAEGDVVADDGTKVGCSTLTTKRIVEFPKVTVEQRQRFAILLSMEATPKDSELGEVGMAWARDWLDGKDRSFAAAGNVVMRHGLNLRHLPLNGAAGAVMSGDYEKVVGAAMAAEHAVRFKFRDDGASATGLVIALAEEAVKKEKKGE